MALVKRDWREPVQSALFRTIRLHTPQRAIRFINSLLAHIGPVPSFARSKLQLHLQVRHLILRPFMGIGCESCNDLLELAHTFLPLLQNLKSLGLYLNRFERAPIRIMSEFGYIAPETLRFITIVIVVSLQVSFP